MLEYAILRMSHGVEKWDLVARFLKLRKQIFIEKMSWAIPSFQDIEFEQYDRHESVYVIAHVSGEVVGGARLMRTDQSQHGSGSIKYSYMIRDAWRGLLDELPRDMCDMEPPRHSQIWELTRFVSVGDASVGPLTCSLKLPSV
jgi:acyl homoserine lactone synthase